MTKAIPFVDLVAQHREIEAEVAEGFGQVMATTAFIDGPDVARFESSWAAYTGTRYAVGVASGTDGLELAIRAVGIAPGDEVVVPANSFIASAAAVARAGGRPVLVDCDDEYQLIDPDAVAAAMSPRTRAIMPVHLFGQLAQMEVLVPLAKRHSAVIIEDAAQCHGARRLGERSGAWGVAAVTSFYPGKNLGAYGDGGAVATNDEAMAARITALRNHGGQVKYQHPTLGFNSRLDALQAVVLAVKLTRLDAWNAARRAAAARYQELLGGVPDVRLPQVLRGNEHVWHLYVIRVPERDRVLAALQAAGIGAGIHYPVPIHLQGAFAHLGYGSGDFPRAEQCAEEILSLPMHPHLTVTQQERVAEVLACVLR